MVAQKQQLQIEGVAQTQACSSVCHSSFKLCRRNSEAAEQGPSRGHHDQAAKHLEAIRPPRHNTNLQKWLLTVQTMALQLLGKLGGMRGPAMTFCQTLQWHPSRLRETTVRRQKEVRVQAAPQQHRWQQTKQRKRPSAKHTQPQADSSACCWECCQQRPSHCCAPGRGARDRQRQAPAVGRTL